MNQVILTFPDAESEKRFITLLETAAESNGTPGGPAVSIGLSALKKATFRKVTTKPLKIDNGGPVKLYAASMGKVFPVTHIADTTEAANAIMAKVRDTGAIAEDEQGRIYMAELYGWRMPTHEFEAGRKPAKVPRKTARQRLKENSDE